jgi:hypothetical protein
MTPPEFRDFIRRQWETVKLRRPVTGGLHPGGPDGSWASVALMTPGEPRSWLHFRQGTAGVESAYGDDGGPDDALRWLLVEESGILSRLQDFAHSYHLGMD